MVSKPAQPRTVFAGNTQDPKTVASQIRKTAERFGCSEVTFVGDCGVLERGQMDDLNEEKFHYITALTKPQIERSREQSGCGMA